MSHVEGRKSRWEWAAGLLAVLFCVSALAWLQASFAGLFDGDSYFHTRAANQWLESGSNSSFAQAQFSTWRDHYSDKDYLFHVLLAPFCGSESRLVPGGKLAVLIFDTLIFLSLLLAIRSVGIRFAFVWVLLYFGAGAWMIQHLSVARPHLLAIVLLILELTALHRERYRTLACLAVLHALSHSSYVLVPGLPVALLIARKMKNQSLPWASLAWAVGGVGVGVLIHPQFPNNLSLGYDQIVGVAGAVWGDQSVIPRDLFGSELLGITGPVFLGMFPVWLPGAIGAAVLFGTRPLRHQSVDVLSLGMIALGLLALTVLSTRFAAFFIPAALLFAGRVWSDILYPPVPRDGEDARESPAIRSWRRPAAIFLLACILLGQWNANVWRVRSQLELLRQPSVYRPAIEYLDSVAEEEEIVYHSFWWAFSWLYHFRPEGRYIEGLDPIFLYRFDPELFQTALELYRGNDRTPAETLRSEFDASWVFIAKLPRNLPIIHRLTLDPLVDRVYEDAFAQVYGVFDSFSELQEFRRAKPEASLK